jgi:hypothetical protein
VTSFVSPLLQNLGDEEEVSPQRMETLDGLLFQTDLGKRVVSFKVWSRDGRILYSPQRETVGMAFGGSAKLQRALEGETVSAISDLSDPENEYERQYFTTLLETYTPVRLFGTGEVVGAVEFYEWTEALAADIGAARLRSWLVVGIATVIMYVTLVGMVQGANLTIGRQRRQLEVRIGELDTALTQNQQLIRQLGAISAVAMAANEIRDQKGMLKRCLEVTLRETGMDAGAIRLVDETGDRLVPADAEDEFSEFPCRDKAVRLDRRPALPWTRREPVFSALMSSIFERQHGDIAAENPEGNPWRDVSLPQDWRQRKPSAARDAGCDLQSDSRRH